jgi:5-(carboxyamino)imidazole ribonucleotide synthase
MTVGILGAGQLGRMLALAGYPLGLDFLFLDASALTPGGQVAPILCGSFQDRGLLGQLAAKSEVVTFDWENVPVDALRALHPKVRIAPSVAALAVAQDRVQEKQLFGRLKIPTTKWSAVESLAQLQESVRTIGLPVVVKTRRMGYDGKGQCVVRSLEDLERAWEMLGTQPLICENLLAFDAEVSAIGARNARGEIALYPLSGNLHSQGMLRLTRAPYGGAALHALAAKYLRRILREFQYVGVLAVEFFVCRGRLIANEMAPRVHNSGHWTIEGAVTSQFENHLRAILDLPLGRTDPLGHSAMINLIGEMPERGRLLRAPGVHLHDYGKTARPGRKLGHCTVVATTARRRDAAARKLLKELALPIRIP